jgi:FkbM family methyltransferase
MYNEIDGWRTIQNDICLKSAKKQGNGDINNYQNIELMTAMSYCAKWRTAVDVGAHVGITAYQMSRSFEHVHAFEINPKIYECMNYNLKQRNVTNVTTYPVGLGARKESVTIKTTNKSFSTHINPSQREGNTPVMPLDFYNLTDVDFIKIDAEGYEPFVAQGGIKTIERCQPIILYECKDHPQRYGFHADSIRQILAPLGYRMIRKIGRGEKNAIIGYRPGIAIDV